MRKFILKECPHCRNNSLNAASAALLAQIGAVSQCSVCGKTSKFSNGLKTLTTVAFFFLVIVSLGLSLDSKTQFFNIGRFFLCVLPSLLIFYGFFAVAKLHPAENTPTSKTGWVPWIVLVLFIVFLLFFRF
jgi:hypothetical protein